MKRAGHSAGKRKRRKIYFNDIVRNEKGEKDGIDVPAPREVRYFLFYRFLIFGIFSLIQYFFISLTCS